MVVILASLRDALEYAYVERFDLVGKGSSAEVMTRSGFAYGCIGSLCSRVVGNGKVEADGRLSELNQETGDSAPKCRRSAERGISEEGLDAVGVIGGVLGFLVPENLYRKIECGEGGRMDVGVSDCALERGVSVKQTVMDYGRDTDMDVLTE